MTITDRSLRACAVALVLIVLASCGDPEDTTSTAGSGGGEAVSGDDALAPKSTDGDPRDLVSFTNAGTATTLVSFDNYEQLRDYSDLAIIGTVGKFTVTKPFEDPYIEPGELQVELTVDAVLGGRMTDIAVGDSVSMVLPFHAPADLFAKYQDRLDRLQGARFAVFLVQMVGDQAERRFSPNLYNAPPAILAEWPGDGRLAPVAAHDYLALEAIQRGVEETGVPYEGEPKWAPTFEGDGPIGLTVADAADKFAGTPGEPAVEAPINWEKLEPLLAPAS